MPHQLVGMGSAAVVAAVPYPGKATVCRSLSTVCLTTSSWAIHFSQTSRVFDGLALIQEDVFIFAFFDSLLMMILSTSRGHLGGIYDLCWSSDSRYIVSGSVDNSAIAWDTQKGEDSAACFRDTKTGSCTV